MPTAEDLIDEELSSWQLNRPMPTHRAWARTMTYPGGPLMGRPIDPDSDPVQSWLIDQLDAHWSRLYVCGPAQVGGKTTIMVLLPITRGAIGCRRAVGYGLPTIKDLDKAYQTKFRPGIIKAGYGTHLPTKGPGSKGGRGHTLQFHDPRTGELEGQVFFQAGGAVGDTVQQPVVDEVDSFRKEDGTPLWADLEDLFHRADSFQGSARRIATGTIECDDPKQSIIMVLIDEHGTGHRCWPRCPHCKTHGQLDWSQVDIGSARISCPRCGALWSEADRTVALSHALFPARGQTVEHGVVTGPMPETDGILGFLWSALESTLVTIRELVIEYRKAAATIQSTGDHSLMRKFHRYRLCRQYNADKEVMDIGSILTYQDLMDRSQTSTWGPTVHTTDQHREIETPHHLYSRHIAPEPEGAEWCGAGVDVQGDRVYWVLFAANRAGTIWHRGWGYEMSRRDHAQHSDLELGAVLRRVEGILLGAMKHLPLEYIALDIGDDNAVLRTWLQARADGTRNPWRAVKGAKALRGPAPGGIEGVVHLVKGVFHVSSGLVRQMVQSSFRRPQGGDGSSILPRGLSSNPSDRMYPQHLVAEQLVTDRKTGKDRVVTRGRHDLLDAAIYTYALTLLWIDAITQAPVPTTRPTSTYGETVATFTV